MTLSPDPSTPSTGPEPDEAGAAPSAESERHERIRSLFLEAIELDPSARGSWITTRCAGAPELAGEIEELLRLSEGSWLLGGDDPAIAPGMQVGPYLVERAIGAGGMGSVLLAEQAEPVRRRVALKVLRSPTLESRIRFRSEAQALAALSHPGICRYLDSGFTDDGFAYLAMEWIEGETLGRHLASARPSVEAAARLVLEIARAVHHAHQRGLVHRDLKPSNIVMRRRGDAAEPVVIDFGVARAIEGSEIADLLLTTQLAPVGTPAFMAPEQTRPELVPDIRSDVHALGAILFLLLTGAAPVAIAEGDDLLEVFMRIRHQPAPRASERISPMLWPGDAARARGRQIRGDLEAIVAMAIEKRPDDRYGSAEQFAAELEAWLEGRPVQARAIGRAERLRRLVRRRPLESMLVAGVAISLLGGTTLALFGLAQARAALAEARLQAQIAQAAEARESEQREVAERQRQQAISQQRIAQAVASFLADDLLARASPELDGPDTPVIEVVRAAVDRTGPALGETPTVEAAVRSTLAGVLAGLGSLDAAEEQLALAAGPAAQLDRDDPVRVALEAASAGLLLRRQRFQEAERAIVDARRRAESILGSDHGTTLRLASDLAATVLALGRPSEAVAILEPIEPALQRRPLVERVAALTTLASARRELGQGRAAIGDLQALLDQVERELGPTHYFTMALHSDVGVGFLELFAPGEALPHAARAAEIALATLGADHPDTLVVRNNLASCYGHLGRHQEATEEREAILAAYRAAGPDRSPALATAVNNLATALIRSGRAAEATPIAEEGARMSTELLGEAHPAAGWAWGTFASALGRTGRLDESRRAYERSLAIFRRAEGDHAASVERIEQERDRLLDMAPPEPPDAAHVP